MSLPDRTTDLRSPAASTYTALLYVLTALHKGHINQSKCSSDHSKTMCTYISIWSTSSDYTTWTQQQYCITIYTCMPYVHHFSSMRAMTHMCMTPLLASSPVYACTYTCSSVHVLVTKQPHIYTLLAASLQVTVSCSFGVMRLATAPPRNIRTVHTPR